jgi:uncharacterized protein (DUF3820 family)
MNDNTIMPFGKYKGRQLKDISDGYLLKLYDVGKATGMLRVYLEERIPVLRATKKITTSFEAD